MFLAAAVLLLLAAEPSWAEALYALQGKVTLSNGTGVNGVSIYVNGLYQGQTFNGNVQCQGYYEGDGCYKIERDAPGLNLCSTENVVGAKKQISGQWYKGCATGVWIYDGATGNCPTPCGRQDIVISYPGVDCPESK